MFSLWGTPEVNVFASLTNKKCNTFCCWGCIDPRALGNGLLLWWTLQWTSQFLYLFPPLPLVSRVLQKIKRKKPHCILLTFWWPKQSVVSTSAQSSWRPVSPSSGRLGSPLHSKTAGEFLDRQELLVDSLVDPALTFSDEVRHVLLNSRKQSTHLYYSSKWKRFPSFFCTKGLSSSSSSLQAVWRSHFPSGLRFEPFLYSCLPSCNFSLPS